MDVLLTDAGKAWLKDHHPKGTWRYDVDKPFKLLSITTRYIELTYLGVPGWIEIPPDVDGQPTIKKAE
jgi:hypothetical protein